MNSFRTPTLRRNWSQSARFLCPAFGQSRTRIAVAAITTVTSAIPRDVRFAPLIPNSIRPLCQRNPASAFSSSPRCNSDIDENVLARFKELAAQNQDIITTINRSMNIVFDQKDWDAMESELRGLESEMKNDTIWEDDAQHAIAVQKRISVLEDQLKIFKAFKTRAADANSMFGAQRIFYVD
ncbi:hypothetical protein HK100_012852 [Physocladia obscura]|uniref:Uncharacterized protein n=1 Tax=Physocladia obscura TaxID=109957 RepID=A0AAD5T1P7_9FUNG|nr:hypothetical protein HK100_012852 [Physocladia obscura]